MEDVSRPLEPGERSRLVCQLLFSVGEPTSPKLCRSELSGRARSEAKLLLSRELPLDPQEIVFHPDQTVTVGKLGSFGYSFSYSGHLVFLAVFRGSGVGVDVERFEGVQRRLPTDRKQFMTIDDLCADSKEMSVEVAFAWTTMEAMCKAAGVLDLFRWSGLVIDPKNRMGRFKVGNREHGFGLTHFLLGSTVFCIAQRTVATAGSTACVLTSGGRLS